jgi:hypothetical protein
MKPSRRPRRVTTTRSSIRNPDTRLKKITRSAETVRASWNQPFGGATARFLMYNVENAPEQRTKKRDLASMGRNAGARAVSDTGSTTGVATVILALLSAGTVAGITLVGVNQLAPGVSGGLHAIEPAAIRPPAAVVVTPHPAAPAPGTDGVSHRHSTKPRTSKISVAPAVSTLAAARGATHTVEVTVPRVRVTVPAVTVPAVTVPAVTVPAVTVPAVTTPAVTTPAATRPPATTPAVTTAAVATPALTVPVRSGGPVSPVTQGRTAVNASLAVAPSTLDSTSQRGSSGNDVSASSLQEATAVLGEKRSRSHAVSGACGEQAGLDQHDGYGDDRSRAHSGGGDGDRGRGHDSGDSRHDRRNH